MSKLELSSAIAQGEKLSDKLYGISSQEVPEYINECEKWYAIAQDIASKYDVILGNSDEENFGTAGEPYWPRVLGKLQRIFNNLP